MRGQRLTDLRFEVEVARIRAYDIFNEINSDDDFDVHCRDESRAGTRVPVQVCRAQFESRISTGAVREYMAGLLSRCPPDQPSQVCIFSEDSQNAMSRAQAAAAETPHKRDLMNDEIRRLALENPQFAQAIVDYYEASQRYDAARRRRDN